MEAARLRVPRRGHQEGGHRFQRVRRREQPSSRRGGVERQTVRDCSSLEIWHPFFPKLRQHRW